MSGSVEGMTYGIVCQENVEATSSEVQEKRLLRQVLNHTFRCINKNKESVGCSMQRDFR